MKQKQSLSILEAALSKEGVNMADPVIPDNSILATVKEGNDVEIDDTSFDKVLIDHVN